jgi:hypothetical protein
MSGRQVLLYFAWSRPDESNAPLTSIDDRFPALFELRRLFYPKFENLAHEADADQGIKGFLDHIQKPNFAEFAEHARGLTGHEVIEVERVSDTGRTQPLDASLIRNADTIVVISFDSLRTRVAATDTEVQTVRDFLSRPEHLIAICPHHDIGGDSAAPDNSGARQLAEHLHHGDRAIPPRQAFGGFARSLLAGLGIPVENRFGLRPAVNPHGAPAPIEVEEACDRLGLLRGVRTFNLHPHLPQLERLPGAIERMDVLARQRIDLSAPPHPFTQQGRETFDALLQSRPRVFAGTVLVSDTTMWSSTAGGVESLRQLWSNVIQRGSIG